MAQGLGFRVSGHLPGSETLMKGGVCIGDSSESTVNPIKLETGLRPNSAGIPYTFL